MTVYSFYTPHVAAESAFSILGGVINMKRTTLSPATAEAQLISMSLRSRIYADLKGEATAVREPQHVEDDDLLYLEPGYGD